MIFPKPGVDLSNPDNFASIGMTVTGLPALNAITVGGRRRRPGCSPVLTYRCAGSPGGSSCNVHGRAAADATITRRLIVRRILGWRCCRYRVE